MSLGNVLEQYMSGLPNLSTTMKKNLSEIGRLDAECDKINSEIQRRIQNFIKNWKSMSKDVRTKFYNEVKSHYQEVSFSSKHPYVYKKKMGFLDASSFG